MATRRRNLWLIMLVSLPAAGLLALGLVGLWAAVRGAESAARQEARRTLGEAARTIGELLAEPELLERLPDGTRFQLAGGELEVSPRVGWIFQPPEADPEVELPFRVVEGVARAERAARAGEAWEAQIEEALAHPEIGPRGRQWVRHAAAWSALRDGAFGDCDRHLQALLAETCEPYPGVAAGALLLCAQRRSAPPDVLLAAGARLPLERARALIERLEELGAGAGSRLAAAHAQVLRSRESLERIHPFIPLLRTAAEASQQVLAGRVLLYHPAAEGSGRGALVAPGELAAALRAHPRAPRVGRLAVGATPAAEELVAGPLLRLAPAGEPSRGWWARPWALGALLLALAAWLATGLALVWRAQRREAAAARARVEFLTSVTHELRTPLSSIRLLSEMLEQGRVASEKKRSEYHSLLARESGRLTALIENVLDLGRLERGERSLELRPQEVAEVVLEALELFAPVAEREGLAVSALLSEETARASLDRGATLQALLNLLDNARKYALEGGSVIVEGGLEGDRYRVRLRDLGPGIPPAEREAIFERFARGAEQRSGVVPGVGLGLYLARELIRRQGGELVCEAPPAGGRGAMFVLTLPLVPADSRVEVER